MDRPAAVALLEALADSRSETTRVGITGPPGVGKSSFIEALGLDLVAAGHRVAVLAVDPTSSVSGGSILGDKTRMAELGRDERAFIRPSPSGSTTGGVARRTREALVLCEAGGYDIVLIETVGSGQSDVAAADLVDVLCLLVPPGGGDDLQGIKRGIMERTDALLVTKADGDMQAAANHTVSDYRNALHLLRGAESHVLAVSSQDGTGVTEAWAMIAELADAARQSGRLQQQRADQAVAAMWSEVETTLIEELADHPGERDTVEQVEGAVRSGQLTPAGGAERLLAQLRGATDQR